MNTAYYARIVLILILCCTLLGVSACGANASSVITPHVNTGEQIAQPSPSVNPFPVHHSSDPDTRP
jgi:hypothetical protein